MPASLIHDQHRLIVLAKFAAEHLKEDVSSFPCFSECARGGGWVRISYFLRFLNLSLGLDMLVEPLVMKLGIP